MCSPWLAEFLELGIVTSRATPYREMRQSQWHDTDRSTSACGEAIWGRMLLKRRPAQSRLSHLYVLALVVLEIEILLDVLKEQSNEER